MTAGAVVTMVGLAIVVMKTFRLPGYWVPVIVGLCLFAAGAIVWAISRDRRGGA